MAKTPTLGQELNAQYSSNESDSDSCSISPDEINAPTQTPLPLTQVPFYDQRKSLHSSMHKVKNDEEEERVHRRTLTGKDDEVAVKLTKEELLE
jgi:hypothetical protein